MKSLHCRPLPLSAGEVVCPRKLGNIISVTSCVGYHDTSPRLCAEADCNNYVKSVSEVIDIRRRDEPFVPSTRKARIGRPPKSPVVAPGRNTSEAEEPAQGDAV